MKWVEAIPEGTLRTRELAGLICRKLGVAMEAAASGSSGRTVVLGGGLGAAGSFATGLGALKVCPTTTTCSRVKLHQM